MTLVCFAVLSIFFAHLYQPSRSVDGVSRFMILLCNFTGRVSLKMSMMTADFLSNRDLDKRVANVVICLSIVIIFHLEILHFVEGISRRVIGMTEGQDEANLLQVIVVNFLVNAKVEVVCRNFLNLSWFPSKALGRFNLTDLFLLLVAISVLGSGRWFHSEFLVEISESSLWNGFSRFSGRGLSGSTPSMIVKEASWSNSFSSGVRASGCG